MKNIIQIIFVSKVAGRSKKTGNEYDMRMAQCIVEHVNPDTGAPEPLIGELVLPEQFKDVAPGRYEVSFDLSVDRDKRIGSRVAAMVPVAAGARPAAPVAPASPVPGKTA